MTAFDSHVNVVGTSIGTPTEEQLADGAPSAVEIAIKVGQQLPFAQGPGQPPVVAEIGTLRFTLDRVTALELFERGLEAANDLPSKPSIDIATSLDGIEAATQKVAALTKRQ